MKTCTCCGRRYSATEYATIPELAGPAMAYQDDDGAWVRLELKNCTCSGTMAIPLPITEAEALSLCA